ncbi:Cardiolipin synthase B [Saezia sanguinis]|uniref:Cardiolipin synthase B n=1 Tax=Saezia sanguinis TaxID=1965230 RepID=A0A433SCF7_9BURK|nr:phospholipase D-like domain-containing protein [Saezia sanguinis]RUS66438.1 Cardiolipin synthase B [Saezia sanguinis]
MAMSDETSLRRRGVPSRQKVDKKRELNAVPQWYLEDSRYEPRDGNFFLPYFCGADVFSAVAGSIKGATRSIDMITWGFDPAIPLVRTDDVYRQRGHMHTNGAGANIPHSGWLRKDAYGQLLLDALASKPDLRVRLVIWYYSLNHSQDMVQNMVGIGRANTPWRRKVNIDRTELDTGFEPIAYGGNDGLNNLPLRSRHPQAQEYSWQWFHKVMWEDFPGADRLAVVFRDISNHSITEEDPRMDGIRGESGSLSFPADHQKTLLIDFEDDANRHAYVMGHNSMTNYWSAFPFVHRDPCNEMDYLPYHDFSMLIKGPLTIDINRNFCEAWELDRKHGLTPAMVPRANENEILLDESSSAEEARAAARALTPPARALVNEARNALRLSREPLYADIANQKIGRMHGQIVRTRPDRMLHGHQEKEVKDAYLQAVRHARNYILIVNQYCQYSKLVRHIKHWRQQAINRGLEGDLYILMGTCKPESENQVFRAQQMANELGVGDQFSVAEDQMYDANSEDSDGNKATTRAGRRLSAADKVPLSELTALRIKPLFFMFYTQAPKGELAQQAYVHAKLMVQDDAFFTLGSSNLNIRSMAMDSELNLISDDESTAQQFRRDLLGHYSGAANSEDFPNQTGTINGEDMGKIFSEMKDVTEVNWRKIKKKEPITGLVAQFEDDRGVVGVVRRG